MTKVAQILYSGLGGHASVVFSMLEANDATKWDSTLGFIGIEAVAKGFAEFCHEHSTPYVYFAATAGKPWKCWPAVLRWLRREKPHAVISHNVSAILPVWLYAKLTGARVIVVEHTPEAQKTKGELLFSALAMSLADHIVMLTQDQMHYLRRTFGPLFAGRKAVLIPNGINTSRYSPFDRPLESQRAIRIGMAGRFTSAKRQDCLVAVMNHLRSKRPHIAWQLSLPGEGVTWKQIDAQVEREGLRQYIDLPGLLDQHQMLHWYRTIDIYAHVSKAETLSTSILQAMAMRLPIVASDAPGIRNLITSPDECGMLVEGFNPERYADAIIDFVDNPDRARLLAHRGREYCVDYYSHEQMFHKYDALAGINIKNYAICRDDAGSQLR